MKYSKEYQELVLTIVEDAFELLNENSFDKYLKFNQLNDSIISSSKLEDHPNIYILAEKLKLVIDSIVTGNKVTEDLNLLIKECLYHIKLSIKEERYELNLNLINSIENSLNFAKKDESDYIYFKKINVLFISKDEFLTKIVLNRVKDGSINFMHFIDINNIKIDISSNNIDLVLLDIPDISLKINEFFDSYSKYCPIVVLCDVDNLNLLSKVSKFPVKEIIPRNDWGIKFLTKGLHQTFANWHRGKQRDLLKPVLENMTIKTLIRDMLITEMPIEQKLHSVLVSEISLNPVIKSSYDLKANEIIGKDLTILDTLIKKQYLVKEQIKSTIICSNCNSFDLDQSYCCNNCFNKIFDFFENVLIHSKCDYTNFKSKFQIRDDDKLHCPKCDNDLLPEEFLIQNRYQCKKCQHFFLNPEITFLCNTCGYGPFSFLKSNLKILYKYKINSTYEKEFKKYFYLLHKLEDFLNKMNYYISLNEKIYGQNAYNNNTFDIIAKKKDKILGIVILTDELETNIEMIFALENLQKSNPQFIPIVISLDEPNQVIYNLLLKFGIFLIISDIDIEIAEKTKDYLYQKKIV